MICKCAGLLALDNLFTEVKKYLQSPQINKEWQTYWSLRQTDDSKLMELPESRNQEDFPNLGEAGWHGEIAR